MIVLLIKEVDGGKVNQQVEYRVEEAIAQGVVQWVNEVTHGDMKPVYPNVVIPLHSQIGQSGS